MTPVHYCVFVFAVVASTLPHATLASQSFASYFQDLSRFSGNGLWNDLVGKCDGPRNTMDCVRSRLYSFVNDTFESDFNVTEGIRFTKNSNDYETVCPGNNETVTAESHREARASETVSLAKT